MYVEIDLYVYLFIPRYIALYKPRDLIGPEEFAISIDVKNDAMNRSKKELLKKTNRFSICQCPDNTRRTSKRSRIALASHQRLVAYFFVLTTF